ncbi:MAG: uracil-DNA glycosylase family protein [Treponema sp.]|nr:uracil-DNA glycosylase family protein [Treponema sp.]
MTVTHPLAPVYDAHATVLILGTMPSPASRSAGFYYMHPQNRFWRVLAALTGTPLVYTNDGHLTRSARRASATDSAPRNSAASIAERRALVLRHGIALWDVLASCDITGAADASIKHPIANDIAGLVMRAPITKIACTGKTAYRYYTALCERQTGIPALCLPSTSPANQGRWPFDRLVDAYRAVFISDG